MAGNNSRFGGWVALITALVMLALLLFGGILGFVRLIKWVLSFFG